VDADRVLPIRLLLCDVDGVLTDAGLRYGPDGESLKVFSARDGHLLRVALASGLAVGLVSGRAVPALRRRAGELGLAPLCLGVKDKVAAVEEHLAAVGLTWAQTAFMGDDLPDLPCLLRAGLSVAPGDAHPTVRQHAGHVTRAGGGRGAVAEFCELLLRRQGRWDPVRGQTIHG